MLMVGGIQEQVKEFIMKIITILILNYILARSKELSTWTGIVFSITGFFGFHMSQELESSLISLGMAFGGVLAALLPDVIKIIKKET